MSQLFLLGGQSIGVSIGDSSFHFFPPTFSEPASLHCPAPTHPGGKLSRIISLFLELLCQASRGSLLSVCEASAPTLDSASSSVVCVHAPRALPFFRLLNAGKPKLLPCVTLAQGAGAASYYSHLCDVTVFFLPV